MQRLISGFDVPRLDVPERTLRWHRATLVTCRTIGEALDGKPANDDG